MSSADPPPPPALPLIEDGQIIVIQRFNYMRTHRLHVTKVPCVQLGQDLVDLRGVLSHPYGSTFKMQHDPDGTDEPEAAAQQRQSGAGRRNQGGRGGRRGAKARPWALVPTKEVVDFETEFLDEEDKNGGGDKNGGVDKNGDGDDGGDAAAEKARRDNRDLHDVNSSQKLSKSEIESMRSDGVSGKEIMAQLIEGSDTFQKKTRFSQAKFLKKKAKKYYEYLTIRKPTLRLLMQIYYASDPMKLMNMRVDTLAQLLNQASVRAKGKYMIYESGCQGVVVAAALERIGCADKSDNSDKANSGRLVHIFQTGNPQTQSLNAMNFAPGVLKQMTTLNMYHLRSLENGEDMTQAHGGGGGGDGGKQKEEAEAKPSGEGAVEKKVPFRQMLRQQSILSYDLLRHRSMDGLIIACKQHPTNLLLTLLRYLAPSRPFAVYSPYKEPLMDAYMAVKSTKKAILVTLTESFLRTHQVLPGRTHPEVNMSGGGGYILSGLVVDDADADAGEEKEEKETEKKEEEKTNGQAKEDAEDKEPEAKRAKTDGGDLPE